MNMIRLKLESMHFQLPPDEWRDRCSRVDYVNLGSPGAAWKKKVPIVAIFRVPSPQARFASACR